MPDVVGNSGDGAAGACAVGAADGTPDVSDSTIMGVAVTLLQATTKNKVSRLERILFI
jgi:sugar (pentulose or hexulose) kinase